jgi:hypothetical protein
VSTGTGPLRRKTLSAHNEAAMRAVVSTAEPLGKLAAVIEETEARCPVMNLLLDAHVDLRIEWLRDSGRARETVPRPPAGA